MLRNAEIRTAVSMYLGGGHRLVEVTGYSILHLGRRVSTERYASGNWHQCVITLEDPTSPQPPNGAVPLPSLSSAANNTDGHARSDLALTATAAVGD